MPPECVRLGPFGYGKTVRKRSLWTIVSNDQQKEWKKDININRRRGYSKQVRYILSFCYEKGNIKILWKGQLHQISCLDFRSYKRPLPKAIPWNSHERSSLFNRQILDRVMKSIFFIYICTLHYIYDYCILHFWKTFLILSHLECSSHIGRFLNDSSVNVKTLKIKLSKN